MSVVWSGITEEGAIVPVQVDKSGKVIATASIPDEYVLRSGDTMTGPLVLPGSPTQPLEAATKKYVDNSAAAGGQLFCAGGTTNVGSTLAYGFNCSSVRKLSEGVFQVYFTEPAFSSDYVVTLTPNSTNRTWRVFNLTPLTFSITFNTLSGEGADSNYFFTVFGPFSDVRVPKSERL